jgi:arylsulfatase A-like enzyme
VNSAHAVGAPTPRLRAAGHALLIGVAAGLVTGALHALIILVTRFGFGRLIWHSRDVIWMAPLSNAVIFGAIALVPAAAALLFRLPAAITAAGFAFLGVFTLLLPFGELARWAVALAALGVAIQIGRRVRQEPARAGRWARRTALAIVLTASVFGLGMHGLMALRRAGAVRGLPVAVGGAPNVLLLVFDTVRGEELSLYGYPHATTPALERWAARGTVFDYAMATAPWTLPSHGSLFTGALGARQENGWVKPLGGAAPTLAERLRDRGYLTAGFAANLLYTSYESGLTRGFIDYQDYPFTRRQISLHAPIAQTLLFQSVIAARSLYDLRQALGKFNLHADRVPGDAFVPARDITDRFLAWQARAGGRPFFAFLNYFDAHGPYHAPPEFRARFPGGKPRDRYDAAIASLDSELDRIFRALEQRGVLDRTIVVVTSDHGELFGEHGLGGHANGLYLPLLRVPLVLLYPPRVPPGLRIREPVSLRDIPATILELAGGSGPPLPGTSLAARWDSSRSPQPSGAIVSQVIRSRDGNPKLPNDRTWLESILDDQHHYIRSGLGKEELYAWRTDSLELNDLAGSPEGGAILSRLRARLDAESSARGRGATAGLAHAATGRER